MKEAHFLCFYPQSYSFGEVRNVEQPVNSKLAFMLSPLFTTADQYKVHITAPILT